jgi:hypothetical protein
MYAGFITPKRVVKSAGIHQRLDVAAYKMIAHYLPDEAFPAISDILNFEGYNGPDGLNTKLGLSPKGLKPEAEHEHNPSHLYDPITDTGEVPANIAGHYRGLVECLEKGDIVRSAFEAAWLAHYVGDGLTPAHHFPLEAKIAEAAAIAAPQFGDGNMNKFASFMKRNWEIWGAKGHMSTHQNFELGIAFALVIFPIKAEFDDAELARARALGPVEYFKAEAREIAGLNLYQRFYEEGWNNDIASIIKKVLAPQAARAIGLIWLLALLEAGQRLATAEVADQE